LPKWQVGKLNRQIELGLFIAPFINEHLFRIYLVLGHRRIGK